MTTINKDQALRQLSDHHAPFKELFSHGSLCIEIYKPEGEDQQQPHDRDEVYVVINGSGTFVCGESKQAFTPGDLLFAPAGLRHRFEDFNEDFSTWVIFYGPVGGEAA